MAATISRKRFCQSVLPLLVSAGPALAIVIPAFTHWDGGVHALVLMGLCSYIPVLNPLCTIVLVKPYHRTVLMSIRRLRRRAPPLQTSSAFETKHGNRSSLS